MWKDKKSTPLVLKTAESHGGGTLWRFEIRSGIYWWDGSEVTVGDVGAFMEKHLDEIATEKSLGLWETPAFTLKQFPSALEFHFVKAPVFGPYIFLDIPLWKPVLKPGGVALPFQCAGQYRVEKPKGADHYTLHAVAAYGKKTFDTIELAPSFPKKTGSFVSIQTANMLPVTPQLLEASTCAKPLELPWVTAIVWNRERVPLEVRKAFSQQIPRKTLAHAGVGSLGSATTSLIPPGYPGASLQVTPPMMPLGPLVSHFPLLRLASLEDQDHLVEKVLSDLATAAGMQVKVVPKDQADAVIMGFYLPSSTLDFLSSFHSKAPGDLSQKDKELDGLLEAYARSLTQETPEFQLLGKISDRLMQLGAITVILHHKACIKTNLTVGVTHLNPDWFKAL